MIVERETSFYNSLNALSARTIKNYQTSIRSSFLKQLLMEELKTDSLFDIDNLDKLWAFYSIVNVHPINVANHRSYSAAIMKYIRFLNKGEKYGKRIDYGKPRHRRYNDC